MNGIQSTAMSSSVLFRQCRKALFCLVWLLIPFFAPLKVLATEVIINLDSVANAVTTDGDLDDPSATAIGVFFTAGKYGVVPIGISQGGAYNSWNAWFGTNSGCDQNGENCSTGWLNWYRLQSSEFSRVRVQDGIIYQTDELALANALSATFSLATDNVVYFFIFDTGPSDNVGGISLRVLPIYTCVGFEPPMDDPTTPVVVRKPNRALPIKAMLTDGNGNFLSDVDLSAPPVIQVTYSSGTPNEPPVVLEEVLSVGLGTPGNEFVFTDDGKWQFNLKLKPFTAIGTYTVEMKAGDAYLIDSCSATFAIE